MYSKCLVFVSPRPVHIGFMQSCSLTDETVATFAAKIFSQYNAVPYHNMWHGFGKGSGLLEKFIGFAMEFMIIE